MIAFYLSDDESGMLTGNIVDYDQSVHGAGDAPVPSPEETPGMTAHSGAAGSHDARRRPDRQDARRADRPPGAGLDLAIVQDVNGDAAAAVGEQLGVPHTTDVDAVLGSDDVDAVAICRSTDTHVPFMIAAAERRQGDLLREADLARPRQGRRGAGDRRARPACRSRSGSIAASTPPTRRCATRSSSGALGDVHLVRITSRDPAPPPIAYIKVSGGIFLDMTIHDFDMARFVTGSEVVEVYAQGAVRVDPAIGEAGDVDTAVVMLRHENGCITTIDNSRQAVYGYDQRVEAFGSGGMAASDNPLTHTGMRRSAAGTSAPPIPYFFLDRYIPSYVEEWKAFVAYVDGGGPSPVTANDGRAPLVIGLAAWRSVRENRPVRHRRDHLTHIHRTCLLHRACRFVWSRQNGWGGWVRGRGTSRSSRRR